METKKILITLILSGLLGACGSVAENSVASLDESQTTIQAGCVNSNLNALAVTGEGGGRPGRLNIVKVTGEGGGRPGRLNIVKVAGEGGGRPGRYRFSADALECTSYITEISGTCDNCNSVLIEVGDKAVTVSVDENGAFSYSFETPTLNNIDLTPLSF